MITDAASTSTLMSKDRDGFACDLCPPSIQIGSRFEFAHHLRAVHCTKEGGSFICRYGPNNVCQTLPVEGVADHDYELHLRKYHITNARTKAEELSRKSSVKAFNVYSFTQNLSSVLSDPKRSRNEVNSFFTRHWGEGFVPQAKFPGSYSIPRITIEHFRSYLTTTAKKHRKCLKAKKALHKALARHHEQTQITSEEIPLLFMDSRFSLTQPETFEAVFLEPLAGKNDPIVSDAELQREKTPSSSVFDGDGLCRPESAASINPQELLTYDAGDGRVFRSYRNLNERLEDYHDLVGSLLNNQLASKGEAFWTTVNSYGSLHDELADAMTRVQVVRSNLQTVNEKIYDRTQRVLQISQSRENRQKLLLKLQDIACLRDAQLTVQMLLNQNDYPKALECIETAQEVLNSDLKGVICFRHLNTQLTELHKVIGKMLQEEFVHLIQKEFGRPCDNVQEAVYQNGQLNPVVLGLMRVKEYRFVQVLKGEVVEAVKNTLRQIVKNRILLCGADLTDFDPSLGYGEQMRKMNFEQWFDSLKAVFESFLLFAHRVQSIQELIIENIEVSPSELTPEREMKVSASSPCFDKLERKESMGESPSDVSTCDTSTLNGSAASLEPSPPPQTQQTASLAASAASILAMTCRTASQVRNAVSVLTEHALIAAEERACRLLVAKSKDGFLERCTIAQFCEVLEAVNEFVLKGKALILNGSASNQASQSRSPLQACMQQQTTKFVARFHEDRKSKLGNILDSELWRSASVPKRFQKIADSFVASGVLRDLTESEENEEETANELMIDGEKYIVVGTALILMQMIGQYCEVLSVLPDCATDLLLYLIELLKNFNSRSCQLILGAGALQLVGLKTISVKNLALASRCLQFIVRFIPSVKKEFESALPELKKTQLRHVNQVLRDYNDHITEISSKLISVIEHHTATVIKTWEVKGTIPSTSFQQICKHLGKFYNGLAGVLPDNMISEMFKKTHENFKLTMKVHLSAKGITPHDSLTYGLVNQDYEYYLQNLRALPCCADFPNESISEVLYGGGGQTNGKES